MLLAKFTDQYNQRAARRNIPDTPNYGHYDMGLLNKINRVYESMAGQPLFSSPWTNTHAFTIGGSKHTGVTRVFREDVSTQLPKVQGTTPWTDYTGDIAYLSQHTNSKVPCTPVGNDDERKLYTKLILQLLQTYSEAKPPLFTEMSELWDGYVDGVLIFRKQPHHLSTYYKIFHKAQKNRLQVMAAKRKTGRHPLEALRSFAAGAGEVGTADSNSESSAESSERNESENESDEEIIGTETARQSTGYSNVNEQRTTTSAASPGIIRNEPVPMAPSIVVGGPGIPLRHCKSSPHIPLVSQ